MKLTFSSKPSKTAILIYPCFDKHRTADDAPLRALLAQLKKAHEFAGKDGETFFLMNSLPHLAARVVLVGLGDAKKLSVGAVMSAYASAIKCAASHKSKSVSVMIPAEAEGFTQAITEACILATFNPSAPYKTGESKEKIAQQMIESLELVGVASSQKAAAEKGAVLGEMSNDLRQWVNAPPNIADPVYFDERAKKVAKESGAKLTILRNKELEKLHMGAFLGVNRGSAHEARLIMLDYKPSGIPKDQKPIVIVGKGIIFDSGGYNLKPRGHIEDMQLDKAGAATVITCIAALAKLGIKRHVVAVAAVTENLIGSKAMKPSEILTTYSGKTVEITNTDGEGRLVLCDAIPYAIDTFKPELLIDIATLTGACMVALGERYAGIFTNNKKLEVALCKAGEEVDELLWALPIHKDDAAKMKGQFADLRNADLGSERNCGASKGAAFIQEFVGETPWAHLDVAGPAFVQDPKKYESKGATGYGLRLLVRYLENV